jgi:MFS family permease
VLGSAGLAGFASTSWNGVYLAELARVAPPGKIGEATSGATLLTFLGYVLGPAVFAMIVDYAASYRLAFAVAALLPASAVIVLRRAKPMATASEND